MDPRNPAPFFDALHVPPTALEQGGVEVMRAVIIDGSLHVSLRRAFDEPETWGILIADVARHVARIYGKDGPLSEDEVLERVRVMFEAELEAPTDAGTTSPVS